MQDDNSNDLSAFQAQPLKNVLAETHLKKEARKQAGILNLKELSREKEVVRILDHALSKRTSLLAQGDISNQIKTEKEAVNIVN